MVKKFNKNNYLTVRHACKNKNQTSANCTRFLRRSNQRKGDSNSGERECAKRAKVMVVGKDKIKTRRILFAKVFSSVFNAGSNFEK